MNDHAQLQGVVERSLFQNTDNGYSVFIMRISERMTVTITGYLAGIQAGQQIKIAGSWTSHPKFGRQFMVESYEVQLPTSLEGLISYLGSGMIKGIGKTYAQKLVNKFGKDVLRVIEQEPERLYEVEGIGQKRSDQIIQSWQQHKEIASIMAFLHSKGVSSTYATKIFKMYGQQSIAVLQENPYRLAEDIWGIGFKTADSLAQKLGLDVYCPSRIKAGILFAICQESNQGHLYVPLVDLRKATLELLKLEKERGSLLFSQALEDLASQEKIRRIAEPTETMVTLASYMHTEQSIAQHVQRLLSNSSMHAFDIDSIYQKMRQNSDRAISLNEDQQRGILTCLQHKITIITGGPGTGKTTLIKTLLSILDEYKCSYKLAAPTGRAAKRMAEGTGRYALTLHRLLEVDPATRSFSKNEQNALKLDFLIIDEASMIDVFLARSLLRALPLDAHLILLGDVDQLPSVGAGNFLNDCIASGIIACIRLTHIFRQSGDSMIIVNAHRINRGEFPLSALPNARRDFFFIKEEDPLKTMEHIRSILQHTLPKYHIVVDDATVLVPMNRGTVGTVHLNYQLQQLLNSHMPKPYLTHGALKFIVGDRVMQVTNNYDKGVFNGDVGTIETICNEEQTMEVRFLDRLVAYERDEFSELVLAYALSIHKSQGSEYRVVIIPLFMQHFMLLQRNLIYTAITRAKQLCIIIGQPKAVAMAIKNKKTIERRTYLRRFLHTDVSWS